MIKGLKDEDRREIVKYRLEKSLRTYYEAVGSISNGYVETAANRLYYAAYYAVSALLVSYKYEASTHNGVIQMFGLAFIKTKIIERRFGTIFNQLFSLRMTGDYEDRHFLNLEEDVKPLVEPTKELIDITTKLAQQQLY
ncbi:MAG: HEPN domain-containing protein [Prevotellaceae bacterium]|nr:HEPN domain-containing protein [Prevotellaceae bacterium]